MLEQPLEDVRDYYTRKLHQHGATAAGVDWNSASSQHLRFEQLLRSCSPAATSSFNDYGCGYGALLPFLRSVGYAGEYCGFDISEDMIAEARTLHADGSARFVSDFASLQPADYTLASGIFNVKLAAAADIWRDHVIRTVHRMNDVSRLGFAFNVLTGYADPGRMRDDLYYADPCFLFDYCKRNLGRRVCLLHDYELYEFTIGVRRDP